MGAFRGGILKFCCARKKSLIEAYTVTKTKILPSNSLFCPPNLATGLFYASLHFHTCGILTSESANISDFSLFSVIFAVSWHRIWDLTVGMIHKAFDPFINPE